MKYFTPSVQYIERDPSGSVHRGTWDPSSPDLRFDIPYLPIVTFGTVIKHHKVSSNSNWKRTQVPTIYWFVVVNSCSKISITNFVILSNEAEGGCSVNATRGVWGGKNTHKTSTRHAKWWKIWVFESLFMLYLHSTVRRNLKSEQFSSAFRGIA